MSNKAASSFQKMVSEHAKIKKKETSQRALVALEEMKAKKLVINFNSLANYAGISKAWLYRHPDLRAQVLAIREQAPVSSRAPDWDKLLKKKETEITQLKQKITSLEKANKELKVQLEIVYGELHQH